VIGSLAAGDSGSIHFAVTVDDPIPAGITEIFNTVSIGEDGASGPEPLIDNTDSEITPLEPPSIKPLLPPTPSPTEVRDDKDDGPTPIPLVTPFPLTPTATVAADPTPETAAYELPVAFLPETGSSPKFEANGININLFFLAGALLGIGRIVIYCQQQFSERVRFMYKNQQKG
jgi:hypothetical protein